MIGSLEIFDKASAMARHAGARQNITAQNVANADVAQYKARDIGSFADHMDSASTPLRTSRAGHITSTGPANVAAIRLDPTGETAPNGNSVSIENEILKSIEAEREHSRALAVYQSSLSILKASIGRR